MIKKISNFFLLFGAILFLFTIYAFVVSLKASKPIKINSDVMEEYSPEIAIISSMKEFKDKIRADIEKRDLSGIEIPILVDDYVRMKFHHGYSSIDWYDNWFLSFLNFFLPQYYFNSMMKPNDIIQQDYAICSQQSIVFQDVIRDYGFDYGSLRFFIPKFSHFTSAVKVEGEWYFFDSNMEPQYDRRDSSFFKAIISGDESILEQIYSQTKVLDPQSVEELINTFQVEDVTEGMIVLSDINTFPAPRGVFIQNISYLISWYGWAISFCISFILFVRIKRMNDSLFSKE